METASLTLHQPREYALTDGSRFEASRITAMIDEHPTLRIIKVFGVLYTAGVGPMSRILVIHPDEPIDLQHHLADSVQTLLATEGYEIT